jgi:hypothetical protein
MTYTSDAVLAPPSPLPRRMKAPSWLDLRLVAGVVLVIASVLLGATVVSAADHRQPRWALSHDLAAGTVLTSSDVHPVRVQLGATDANYLPVSEPVVGRTLHGGGRAGQLLARAELSTPEPGVAVSVPLRATNGPEIVRGDRVTVWLSTKTCQATVLLSGVPVQAVTRGSGASFSSDGGTVLELRLPSAQAKLVVAALDLPGAVVRAGVLSDGQDADQPATELSRCGSAGS